MKSASSLFSEQDRARISAAIAAAESGTAGEIVPVVATSSGRYDRAEDLFGLVVALAAVSAIWFVQQGTGEAAWSGAAAPRLGLIGVLAIFALGFIGGAWLASRVPLLRLPFISSAEIDAEVDRAARAAFQTHRVRGTAGGTGLLIYVSLYEHRVRVLGDDAVDARVSLAEWDAICAAVVDGMRRDDPTQGLLDGLALAGSLLTRLLPRDSGEVNELPDQLILID
jgi:putative membrane protein